MHRGLKNIIKKKLKFPVVIKPINEGSSVGVYITSEKNFIKKLSKLKKYQEVMIEEYIAGRNTSRDIRKEKAWSNRAETKRKFYDYKAKYDVKSKTEHIIPVKLQKKKLIKF